MSAIIAIMNKNGIALAADSAATISDGRDKKIYLNANKIFTLSKFHPVGVMIYNSASFMDTPWEILIKVYRKQLGNTSFGTLNDYYINFIEFLRARSFFSSLEEQKDILGRKAFELLDRFSEETFFKHKDLFKDVDSNINEINSIYKEKAESFINFIKTEYTTCSDFEDYSKDNFLEFSDSKIEEVLDTLQLTKFKFNLNR